MTHAATPASAEPGCETNPEATLGQRAASSTPRTEGRVCGTQGSGVARLEGGGWGRGGCSYSCLQFLWQTCCLGPCLWHTCCLGLPVLSCKNPSSIELNQQTLVKSNQLHIFRLSTRVQTPYIHFICFITASYDDCIIDRIYLPQGDHWNITLLIEKPQYGCILLEILLVS